MNYVWLWVTISAGVAGSVRAQTPVRVDDRTRRVELTTGLATFADPSGRLRLEPVTRHTARYPFAPVASPVSVAGPTAQFIRLCLVNRSGRPLPMLLELDHPFVEQLETVLTANDRIIKVLPVLSQRVPQARRPYAHRNFVLPLTLPAGPSTVYLRLVKGPGAHAFPVRLWQPAAFTAYAVADSAFWSALIGWLLFAVVLSVLLAAVTGEPVYWFYGLYIVAHLLAVIVNEGLFSDLYTAGLPFLRAEYVGDWAIGLILGSNVLFVRSLLSARQYVPQWTYRLSQVTLLIWGSWLLGYIADSLAVPALTQPVGLTPLGNGLFILKFVVHLLCAGLTLVLVAYSLRTPMYYRRAWLYLLAYIPIFGVAILYYFANLWQLPVPQYAQTPVYAVAVGFETAVLLFGLAYRFKTYRDERERLLLDQSRLAVRTQLAERERLARDLHDHIGPDLVALKLQLEAAREDDASDSAHRTLDRMIEQADHIVADLRQVSHALVPVELTRQGLTATLDDYVRQLSHLPHRPEINLIHTLAGPLPEGVALGLLRIAKELMTNALKHADATLIDVELYEQGNRVCLTVSDNGRGYDPAGTEYQSPGIGLHNVRAVVDQLHGRVDVVVKPSGGMAHRVSVPV